MGDSGAQFSAASGLPVTPATEAPAQRRTSLVARLVTYGLCGSLLLVGTAQLELWPMSAFRLFSGVRGAETTSWVVVTVDAAGEEHRLDLGGNADRIGLPHHLLPKLQDASTAERQAVLETYVEAAGDDDTAVAARVYRVVSQVPTEAGVASTELSRDLAYEVALP